jgi:hypothetical protein
MVVDLGRRYGCRRRCHHLLLLMFDHIVDGFVESGVGRFGVAFVGQLFAGLHQNGVCLWLLLRLRVASHQTSVGWRRYWGSGRGCFASDRHVGEGVGVLSAYREGAVDGYVAAGATFANGFLGTGGFQVLAGFFAVLAPKFGHIKSIKAMFQSCFQGLSYLIFNEMYLSGTNPVLPFTAPRHQSFETCNIKNV